MGPGPTPEKATKTKIAPLQSSSHHTHSLITNNYEDRTKRHPPRPIICKVLPALSSRETTVKKILTTPALISRLVSQHLQILEDSHWEREDNIDSRQLLRELEHDGNDSGLSVAGYSKERQCSDLLFLYHPSTLISWMSWDTSWVPYNCRRISLVLFLSVNEQKLMTFRAKWKGYTL